MEKRFAIGICIRDEMKREDDDEGTYMDVQWMASNDRENIAGIYKDDEPITRGWRVLGGTLQTIPAKVEELVLGVLECES